MITISFYSYKGGVGRSLTLANLGVYLAQFGATVVMVDFDLEAPGLHYKLRPDQPIGIPNRGLAGLLADASRDKPASAIDWDLTLDVSEYAQPVAGEPEGGSNGKLYLVPAGNPLHPEYWNDLAAIDWDHLFVSEGRPGVFALSQLKERVEDQIEPDVLLVDSRTGITPGGGVSTTLLPDVVVMMMLNTPEHVDGSRLVVSAVSGTQRAGEPGPVVVPVLSRYTGPGRVEAHVNRASVAKIHAPTEQLRIIEPISKPEEIPLASLESTLVEGLTDTAATRIRSPLVLHADPTLQQQEYLTFGRYAQSQLGDSGQTLLEDYLRLFAALVPKETFLKYLTGVRERARTILLDNPDDAVRSLESLTTLTGDEGAFIDLVKVYLLRRESRKLITAAESLFRVHERIVPEPALTRELRNLLTGRGRAQRLASEGPMVSSAFAKAYWQEVAPEDVEWGGTIARLYGDRGELQRGKELADEIIAKHGDPKALAELVRVLAFGKGGSEVLAVQVATEYFDIGKGSGLFLAAAAVAARYQEDDELAERIIESPGSDSLDAELQVRLLVVAGRLRAAAGLFIEAFGASDPAEVDLDDLSEIWSSLGRRVPELHGELRERNPELADHLELLTEEDPF